MSNYNPFIPDTMNTPNSAPFVPGGTAPNESFEVDLTDVQEQSYAIPDGSYRAKCIDVIQDVSKSGNPMFVWEFEITEGKYTGRTFKSWTAITPAAMWKVAETVIALGVGQNGQVVKFKRGDVINKECGIVMEQDEYNGKPTSRISRVISLKELLETPA
jgi:hypothetical protein